MATYDGFPSGYGPFDVTYKIERAKCDFCSPNWLDKICPKCFGTGYMERYVANEATLPAAPPYMVAGDVITYTVMDHDQCDICGHGFLSEQELVISGEVETPEVVRVCHRNCLEATGEAEDSEDPSGW